MYRASVSTKAQGVDERTVTYDLFQSRVEEQSQIIEEENRRKFMERRTNSFQMLK